jgi:signal peptidase I
LQDGKNSPFCSNQLEPLRLSASALTDLLKKVMEKGRPFRFEATGFSMSPFIKNGDLVTLSPLDRSGPRLGDVVAFTPPGSDKLILHRVVGKRGASFYTKGDSLSKIDLLLPKEQILAKVARVDRNGKKVHLCLGPERRLIALFSRFGLLLPIILSLWKLA